MSSSCIVAGFELETLSRDKYFENNSKMSSAGIILCECTEVYNVLNQVCLALCLSTVLASTSAETKCVMYQNHNRSVSFINSALKI